MDATPPDRPATAAALVVVAVGATVVELVRTGHGRVVAVLAFGAVLLAVLHAVAGLLDEQSDVDP